MEDDSRYVAGVLRPHLDRLILKKAAARQGAAGLGH